MAPGSASDRAGLRPNDKITTWTVANDDGGRSIADLSTPYDLSVPCRSSACRGWPLSLVGGARVPAPHGPCCWGYWARLPADAPAVDSTIYRSARERERARASDAASRLREAARAAEPISSTTAVWLLALAGTILSDNMQFEQADEFMAESRNVAAGLNRPPLMALLHRQAGRSLRARSQWTRAIEHLTLALEFDRQEGDENLACALDYLSLGEIDLLRGDLTAAEPHYQRSLAIRESLAPNSVEVADVLNGGLGNIAAQRGDFAGATNNMKRALAIADSARAGLATWRPPFITSGSWRAVSAISKTRNSGTGGRWRFATKLLPTACKSPTVSTVSRRLPDSVGNWRKPKRCTGAHS